MDTDVRTVLDKAPLAEATWLLFNQVLPDDTLNAIYDTHRGVCYQREFTFANLVHLVNDALCQHGGRAQQTLDRHADSDACPASVQAFYGKLRRMPVALSEALLTDGAERLQPWLSPRPRVVLPASVRAFRVLAIDGKSLKHAAKRLKPVRGHAGRGLGGKALVALELATGLLVGMTADPDGHVNEAKLVPQLLPRLREQLPGVNLWIADQQFGDLAQVRRCTEAGDHCVLRLHPKSQFFPDAQQPARHGVDAQGRAWVDDVGTLQSTRQGCMTVRRITLTRAGDKPLVLVTDLLDGALYPANDLLELYRERWGIEQVFQQVAEVFHLNHLIGSSPQAIIFQASLCMLLYNLLQVVRGLVADTQERPPETLSTYNLLYDLQRELNALHFLVPPDDLVVGLRARAASIPDLRTYLFERLSQAWNERWIKSPPKKRHLKPTKHKRGTAGHFSIHRVLVAHKKAKDV
jgi:hypothetical protein